MKKLLLIMAFLLPGFDMQTSSACGCQQESALLLEDYVGHPAYEVIWQE